jgi:hypothetical protein
VSLERTRKRLIFTGIPLATICLGFGILFGGIYAMCAAMGVYVAMRTHALIHERT